MNHLTTRNSIKIIFSLVALSLFATPCFAQVTTEKYFTPEGTLWELPGHEGTLFIGFFNGDVWWCNAGNCIELSISHYNNRFFAFFFGGDEGSFIYGYVIPMLGFGTYHSCVSKGGMGTGCSVGRWLIRVSNNFSGSM